MHLDARQFSHKMNKDGVKEDYFFINLPQFAPEFLDAFHGWKFYEMHLRLMVHHHCFDEKAHTSEETTHMERNKMQHCERA